MTLKASALKLSPVAVLAALTAAYLAFTSPSGVQVSANGEIKSWPNQARALLQGDKFWDHQLRAARRELQRKIAEPEQRQKLRLQTLELQMKTQRMLDELHAKNPAAAPSPAQRHADALREQADAIESAEIEMLLEQHRLKRMGELQRIIESIEGGAWPR